MKWLLPVGWFCVILLAVFLRTGDLERRTLHGDEGVNAVLTQELWDTGRIVYDPTDYHGPALYYATLPLHFCGVEISATALRGVSVFFGVATLLGWALLGGGLGTGAALFAGLLAATSPALAHYSRYFIHETLLGFATMAVIVTGWRFALRPHWGWAIAVGGSLGLAHATKETCVIALGSLVVALGGATMWTRSANEFREFLRARKKRLAASALVAVTFSVILFSGFFSQASGPIDSVLAFGRYFDRAHNAGWHTHPWHFYLSRLAFHPTPGPTWSEGLILALGLAGGVAIVTRRGIGSSSVFFLRFLLLYAFLMVCFYSAIPYKTPWCLVQFAQPLILVAGVGSAAIARSVLRPWAFLAMALLFGAGVFHLSRQAHLACHRYESDYRNPYVYAQPLQGVVRLANWLDNLARVHPEKRRLRIQVLSPNPWPLPFYLRRFERVGYWEQPVPLIGAPVVVVSSDLPEGFDPGALASHQVSHYGLRPGVRFTVYVDPSLWQAFVADEERERGARR